MQRSNKDKDGGEEDEAGKMGMKRWKRQRGKESKGNPNLRGKENKKCRLKEGELMRSENVQSPGS